MYSNNCYSRADDFCTLCIGMPLAASVCFAAGAGEAAALGAFTTCCAPTCCIATSAALGATACMCLAGGATGINERRRRIRKGSPQHKLMMAIVHQQKNAKKSAHKSEEITEPLLSKELSSNNKAFNEYPHDTAAHYYAPFSECVKLEQNYAENRKAKFLDEKDALINLLNIVKTRQASYHNAQSLAMLKYAAYNRDGDISYELGTIENLSPEILEILQQRWSTLKEMRKDYENPTSLHIALQANLAKASSLPTFHLTHLRDISNRIYDEHPLFAINCKNKAPHGSCTHKNEYINFFAAVNAFLKNKGEIYPILYTLPNNIWHHILTFIPEGDYFFEVGLPNKLTNVLSPKTPKEWVLSKLEHTPFEEVQTLYRVPKRLLIERAEEQ